VTGEVRCTPLPVAQDMIATRPATKSRDLPESAFCQVRPSGLLKKGW
jgi:hypothetical protein